MHRSDYLFLVLTICWRPDDDVEDDRLEEELDDSLHHGLDQVDPPRRVPRRLPAAGQHTPADQDGSIVELQTKGREDFTITEIGFLLVESA